MFVHYQKKLILHKEDVLKLCFNNSLLHDKDFKGVEKELEYFTKIKDFKEGGYKNKKYWAVQTGEFVEQDYKKVEQVDEKINNEIFFESIHEVVIGDECKNTKSMFFTINKEELSEGTIVGIEDIKKEKYQFQIKKIKKYNKEPVFFGFIAKLYEKMPMLKSREGEAINGKIYIEDINTVLFSVQKKVDRKGKKLRENVVVKFETPLGVILYKFIKRIEEMEGVIKLWGGETCSNEDDARKSKTDGGFVFAHDVEIIS